MNINISAISTKLKSTGKRLTKYAGFIAVLLVLGAYGFIVYRIGTLTSHEPEDDVVAERLKNLKKPSIDQATIDKIEQLEDSNVQVKSLFDQARDNPFQD